MDIEFKVTFDFSGGWGLLLFRTFGITWLESELRRSSFARAWFNNNA